MILVVTCWISVKFDVTGSSRSSDVFLSVWFLTDDVVRPRCFKPSSSFVLTSMIINIFSRAFTPSVWFTGGLFLTLRLLFVTLQLYFSPCLFDWPRSMLVELSLLFMLTSVSNWMCCFGLNVLFVWWVCSILPTSLTGLSIKFKSVDILLDYILDCLFNGLCLLLNWLSSSIG